MIAVDIDGVIADSEPILVKCLEYFTGESFDPPSPRTYDFRDGFENLSLRHCLMIIDNTLLTKHIPVYDFERTYLALAKIQQRYGKVHFITSRSSDLWEKTNEWIKSNFGHINYELQMTDHLDNKEFWMFKYDLNIIIEDRLKIVNNIKNSYNSAYLINRPWNIGRPINGNVIRVDNILDAITHHLGEPDV
jgi:uncharacterized HAD superfamily protein